MQQHYCDLQPEDLSLHSNNGVDRVAIHAVKCTKDKTSFEQADAELNQELENEPWKSEIIGEEERSSVGEKISDPCKELNQPLDRMPNSRERETSETTAGQSSNALVSNGEVISIITTHDTAAGTAQSTTVSPETIVKKMDEVIAPTATIIITEENP